jgi:hypothetical protein
MSRGEGASRFTVRCDWSAIRCSIKFGAGAGPIRGTYISSQSAPDPTIDPQLPPPPQDLVSNIYYYLRDVIPLFACIASSPSTFHSKPNISMGNKVVESIRSYAASVFCPPVDRVDNDMYTVCWRCLIRNYKPHDGQCSNCGITL